MDDRHILSSHRLFSSFPIVSLHLEVFQYIPKPFCSGSSHSFFPFDFNSDSLGKKKALHHHQRPSKYSDYRDLRRTVIKVRASCAVPSVCSYCATMLRSLISPAQHSNKAI